MLDAGHFADAAHLQAEGFSSTVMWGKSATSQSATLSYCAYVLAGGNQEPKSITAKGACMDKVFGNVKINEAACPIIGKTAMDQSLSGQRCLGIPAATHRTGLKVRRKVRGAASGTVLGG